MQQLKRIRVLAEIEEGGEVKEHTMVDWQPRNSTEQLSFSWSRDVDPIYQDGVSSGISGWWDKGQHLQLNFTYLPRRMEG